MFKAKTTWRSDLCAPRQSSGASWPTVGGISFDSTTEVIFTMRIFDAGGVPFSPVLESRCPSRSIFFQPLLISWHTLHRERPTPLALAVGRVTNATTASFVLATGRGVTQNGSELTPIRGKVR